MVMLLESSAEPNKVRAWGWWTCIKLEFKHLFYINCIYFYSYIKHLQYVPGQESVLIILANINYVHGKHPSIHPFISRTTYSTQGRWGMVLILHGIDIVNMFSVNRCFFSLFGMSFQRLCLVTVKGKAGNCNLYFVKLLVSGTFHNIDVINLLSIWYKKTKTLHIMWRYWKIIMTMVIVTQTLHQSTSHHQLLLIIFQ